MIPLKSLPRMPQSLREDLGIYEKEETVTILAKEPFWDSVKLTTTGFGSDSGEDVIVNFVEPYTTTTSTGEWTLKVRTIDSQLNVKIIDINTGKVFHQKVDVDNNRIYNIHTTIVDISLSEIRDEYIELYNNEPTSVDISDWQLKVMKDTDVISVYEFPNSVIIPGKSYWIIATDESRFYEIWGFQPDWSIDTLIDKDVTIYLMCRNDNSITEIDSRQVDVQLSPTPKMDIPSLPRNVKLTNDDGKILLRWDEPLYGSSIIGYNIYRYNDEETFTTFVDKLEYVDDNVVDGVCYYYRISAVTENSEGYQSPKIGSPL
jgi:hypothetical protein